MKAKRKATGPMPKVVKVRMIPSAIFFTNGVGQDTEKLVAFEESLRDAGIEHSNFVCVSSILPPNCRIVSKKAGVEMLRAGQLVHCVLARVEFNEANRLMSASIGLAVPTNRKETYGYLSEHHGFGEPAKISGDYAEDLAATMLATTLGLKLDANKAWREREKIYKQSGLIVSSRNITRSARGEKGKWTSVVAAAVFCEYQMEIWE